jgi:hypothetical protein
MQDGDDSPEQLPSRDCDKCGGSMRHLVNLRSAGVHAAKQIFYCDKCTHVISEEW